MQRQPEAKMIAPLSTERLELSAPSSDDIPEIVRLANDMEVVRTLARLPYPYEAKDAQFFLEEIVPVEPNWKVTRKSDAALIGFVGLAPREPLIEMELGYWLGRAYWQRGYATEAARAVVTHAFEDLGIQRLTSGHFAMNLASGNVLAKLGFRQTGRSERFSQAAGKSLPHVDVLLTRSSWSADAARHT